MSSISRIVSKVLDYHINEGQWTQPLETIDKAGEPTQKHMTEIVFALCSLIEDMEGRLVQLEQKKGK